ncbi:hypothetical protein [Faecalicatena orotica]|nr:hypothetical protein [Faecalicatena orotica]
MMSQRSYYMCILAFLSVLTIFLIIIAIVRIKNGKNAEPNEFDERQKLIRGESFKYAYAILILYLLFNSVIEDLTGKYRGAAGILLGIFVSLAVAIILCIWKDAFFNRDSTGKSLTVSNIFLLILDFYWGIPAILDPKNTYPYSIVFFYAGVLNLLILAIIAVKSFKDRREKDVESL